MLDSRDSVHMEVRFDYSADIGILIMGLSDYVYRSMNIFILEFFLFQIIFVI